MLIVDKLKIRLCFYLNTLDLWLMSDLLFFLEKLAIPLLTVLSLGLTFYFAYKKFGHYVSATFSIVSERSSETRIDNIILQNHKDRPECIYRIFAVFDNEYYLELKEFNEPLILNAYESIVFNTEPYSKLIINNDVYVSHFFTSNIKIYIELFNKVIECNTHAYKKSTMEYKQITKKTNKYNGIVYNDYVTYILVYVLDGISKTAFIYDSGAITEQWNLNYNYIKPKNGKITFDEIISFLKIHYSEKIPAYELLKINNQTLKFDSIKKHNLN